MANSNNLPIGVFDSGVGGLTVLQELQQQLPQESFLYLGDMARLPYGTKSQVTVTNYAAQACNFLVNMGIKALVVACNTASAYALSHLRQHFPHLPIIGVIEPGAEAAVAASRSGHIAVIATEATINNKAYENSIIKINPDAIISTTSCALFVSLAEEGWISGHIPQAVAKNYLSPLFNQTAAPDCLVLGCTHFPILLPTIRSIINDTVTIVDSAVTTSQQVKQLLAQQGLLNTEENQPKPTTFLATDNPQRFIRVAKNFLQLEIPQENIELVDIHDT